MKSIKKLLGVFVLTLILLTPNMVFASSDAFSKFPTYEKDGKEYLDIKAINPEDTPTEYCNNVYGDDEESQETCRNDYVLRYLQIILKDYLGTSFEDYERYSYKIIDDKINITYCPLDYQLTSDCEEKEYNIIWEEYKNKDELIRLSKEIKETYTVYGETHINMAYHIDNFEYYNYLHGNMEKGNYDLVLSYYPGFKEILEEYPEYEFVLISAPSGGLPLQLNGGAMVGILKDGVLLNVEYVDFRINNILFVPIDESNELITSAENLLKKSFNENKEIKITKNTDFDDEMTDSDWQEYLKEVINVDEYLNDTHGRNYKYELVSVKVNNSTINNFMLIEIPKEKYRELKVKSKDKSTGINIVSKGLDVPIDVKVYVENLKNNQEINKNGEENKIKFEEIFDITLKRRYDGSFVEKTPLGVEVYIPVSNHKENDEVNIYYIKDNIIQDEIITGTVVKVADKLYVKFIAKHFSTYAIGHTEITTEPTKVTFDANGGKFGNENTLIINDWTADLYDSLITPTREKYTFKGYYTEKSGGTKFEMILNEAGIENNSTFYAQWEENSNISIPEVENPKTFDSIGNNIFFSIISLIGVVGVTIYFIKKTC